MKIKLSKRFEKEALAINDKRIREKIQQVLIQAQTVEGLGKHGRLRRNEWLSSLLPNQI
jgi:hypothetical protein